MVLLAGLLVSLFAGILTLSSPVSANDATWDGAHLEYNNDRYGPVSDPTLVENLGLPVNTRLYATSEQPSVAGDFRIIYYPADADMMTADSAQYAVYRFTPPDNYQRQSSSTISTQPASENEGGLQSGTSCDVYGIGWLVCPLSNWIAIGMDWLYEQLTGFLVSQPLNLTNRDNSLYQAWRIMLNIANILFIVMFIVIIYSQVSSIGLSNYGIKKMLPRLIIAALLVNLSFYICAIAIDLSNIIGFAIQDMFIDIRNTITTVGVAGGEAADYSWESVTSAVLAGGVGVGAAGVAMAGYQGVTSAALIMLLPLLLGLLITVLVVLLVLAARQALIVILTIISPIAFVCYLLPGTEKWFGKWKDLFFTMLIFFPAFSAVFGGSQLAGAAILQNASNIIMAILGLAVQVAPLAIAPLILKLSGGLLNRFAGVINDPTKGILDKSKQWASDASKVRAAQSHKKLNERIKNRENKIGKNGQRRGRKWHDTINPYGKVRKFSQYANHRSRLLKDQASDAEKSMENSYHESDMFKRHDLKSRHTNDQSELLNQQASNRYDELKGGQVPTDLKVRLRDKVDSKLRNITIYDQRVTKGMDTLSADTQKTFENLATEGMRKTNAQRALNTRMSETMLKDEGLQERAASIYKYGKQSAVASAIATSRSDFAKSVEEGSQIVKHFNLSAEERQVHALGQETFTATREDGTSYTFDKDHGIFTREAAIEEQMAVGTVDQVSELVSLSGTKLADYRTTISASLAKSSVKGKAPYLGGRLINEVGKGTIGSKQQLTQYIQEWIAEGKFKPEDISSTDPQGLNLLMEAARATPNLQRRENESDADYTNRQNKHNTKLLSGRQGLIETADMVLKDHDLKAHVTKGAEPLLKKIQRGDFSK